MASSDEVGNYDLILTPIGGSPNNPAKSGRITIRNFPFEKSKAFGFCLDLKEQFETTSKTYDTTFTRLLYPTTSSAGTFYAIRTRNLGTVY